MEDILHNDRLMAGSEDSGSRCNRGGRTIELRIRVFAGPGPALE